MKRKNDNLVEAALEIQDDIRRAYRLHEKHRPVMLFHVQEDRIYAYPYIGYKETLSERSQAMLEKQYEEAQKKNKIVVFVRDDATRRLASFSLEYTGDEGTLRVTVLPRTARNTMSVRKYVKPDEKVGLNLTAAERKIILNDVEFLDDDYEQALRETPADQAIEFTLGDWDYLGGEISSEAKRAGGQKRKRLNGIFARIEELLAAHYTDEEPE
jgi:hypothetical protein